MKVPTWFIRQFTNDFCRALFEKGSKTMTATIPVTAFEAGVAYARGKMEEFEGTDPVFIQLVLNVQGVEVRVLSRRDDRQTSHVISWHDIIHQQYDALRFGIERAIGQWAGYRQSA